MFILTFTLLAKVRRKTEAPPESHEAFEVDEAATYGLLNLVLSPQTSFLSASIRLLINHR